MPDTKTTRARSLGETCLHGVWVFQTIAAIPIFLILGFCALSNMLLSSYGALYYFITDFVCSILTAGILFTLFLQKGIKNPSWLMTLRLEILKSGLATALWVWMLMDAIFASGYDYNNGRPRRIKVAIISFTLLL
ncbi:uncharacterized protein JN550_011774 [Neoarthrinium moseri]|uniref:uncharacterized protein n=1 Tax=Neoarthrinium moseri TaxID=1658444 RepID=UPI001FDB4DBD|nr:uncharacterized protein JN550_011774 [Neoarthrinium moseri]KAI1859963.1 hypothetical protein JN550_011774 [Neoarthrinium moseri]